MSNIYIFLIYKYSFNGDNMLENIELSLQLKHDFKVMSTKENKYMKDLILEEAREILDSNSTIPSIERSENYTSLIISIPEDLKEDIKDYCATNEVRIRDFWVECVNRSMNRYV